MSRRGVINSHLRFPRSPITDHVPGTEGDHAQHQQCKQPNPETPPTPLTWPLATFFRNTLDHVAIVNQLTPTLVISNKVTFRTSHQIFILEIIWMRLTQTVLVDFVIQILRHGICSLSGELFRKVSSYFFTDAGAVPNAAVAGSSAASV